MNVLGPLVALDPDRRFGLLQAMAGDPHPWTRRLALVACTRLARTGGAAALWPRVAELLLALAPDREAALPKACSWVLRSWLEPCPGEVAAFVDTPPGPAARPGGQGDQGQAGHRLQAAPAAAGGRRPATAGGRR